MDTPRGQLWPLQVFFLVTLTGAVVALVMRLGVGGCPGYGIAFALAGLSLAAAVVLIAPRYWVFMRVPALPKIEERLNEIPTAIADLRTRLDAIATQLNAVGDVRTRLDAIAGNLDATGVVGTQLTAIATQLNAVGDVRTRLDAIAGNLDATGVVGTQLTAIATQLNAMGDVGAKLNAIDSKLQK